MSAIILHRQVHKVIKFNRVNGWTYKTEDDQYIVYNGGSREWYSAKVDPEMAAKYGFVSVSIIQSTRQYHSSITEAQQWVREVEYKEVA